MDNLPFYTISPHVAFLGPDLKAGPLPTLFYFSLSAQDSLLLDPFNQLPVFLTKFPVRIFSITLPFHEPPLSPLTALEKWAEQIDQGVDVVAPFAREVAKTVAFLDQEQALLPGKLAIAGLSRGAFLAAHAAANIPLFKTVLGFAPLTSLCVTKEFASLQESSLAKSLAIEHLIEKLTGKSLRFYIGNLDTRVGLERCFSFVHQLANASFRSGIRSPLVELIITPSIGRDGHGTSKQIFEEGGKWLLKQWGIQDV